MDVQRWAQLSPLLDELLELDEPLRERRLQQLQHGDDPSLAPELRRLLAIERQSAAFIVEPLLGHHDRCTTSGDRIGRYRLAQLLGEGGMGQVWLAIDESEPGQPPVALKLLRPDLADPHLRARFLRERDLLASFDHPRIPRLREAGGDAAGTLYLALEYVAGEPITDYCQRHALPPRRCVELFLQVCAALDHVHSRGVIHRDLKPSNILVDVAGTVRLLDFGIARRLDEPVEPAQEADVRAFTLHYAAPEQIRGEVTGVTADVYALGVVLYELLTGEKPYRLRRQSDAEWERAVLRAEIAPPSCMVLRHPPGPGTTAYARRSASLRGELDGITLKALEKQAEARYPDIAAFAGALDAWLRAEAARPRPSFWQRCLHGWRSHPPARA